MIADTGLENGEHYDESEEADEKSNSCKGISKGITATKVNQTNASSSSTTTTTEMPNSSSLKASSKLTAAETGANLCIHAATNSDKTAENVEGK